ncbi:uncharacterized protein KY384_007541 [Bacidia gigantensis]|uniref:uncharacterized protein n=1 Tax=Bacidia gigantensis TaxID=2732470 RepID=UPI001D045EA3|nr:uncharacterized protein KY384_007541 [Bacidia gigantensis]KAG8527389.1 hypothetical protein KY384_007541 [Bacidia gigantensis]
MKSLDPNHNFLGHKRPSSVDVGTLLHLRGAQDNEQAKEQTPIEERLLVRRYLTTKTNQLKEENDAFKKYYKQATEGLDRLKADYSTLENDLKANDDNKKSEEHHVEMLKKSHEVQILRIEMTQSINEDLRRWNDFYQKQNGELFEDMMSADQARWDLHEELSKRRQAVDIRKSSLSGDPEEPTSESAEEFPLPSTPDENDSYDRGRLVEPEFPGPKGELQYLFPFDERSRNEQNVIHVLLTRALFAEKMERWIQAFEHAKTAKEMATGFGYDPLVAYCSFHQGTALNGQEEYVAAIEALEAAEPAVDKYISRTEIDDYKTEIEEAPKDQACEVKEEGEEESTQTKTHEKTEDMPQNFQTKAPPVPKLVLPEFSESEDEVVAQGGREMVTKPGGESEWMQRFMFGQTDSPENRELVDTTSTVDSAAGDENAGFAYSPPETPFLSRGRPRSLVLGRGEEEEQDNNDIERAEKRERSRPGTPACPDSPPAPPSPTSLGSELESSQNDSEDDDAVDATTVEQNINFVLPDDTTE